MTAAPREPAAGAPGALEDAYDSSRPLGVAGVLGEFAAAGLLHSADVHVARLLGRLAAAAEHGVTRLSDVAGEDAVLLAAAFAVRALRLGSVCLDLGAVAGVASAESEGDGDGAGSAAEPEAAASGTLPWPDPTTWLDAVATSTLAAGADDGRATQARPLRIEDGLLYLDRYWRDERLVAEVIGEHCVPAGGVDMPVLADGLARLFPRRPADDGPGGEGDDLQRIAAASAVLGRFTVVSGGPGTGKTTTVARLLALVHEQALAAGRPAPLVALAAPTGKAAARLEQAVHQAASAFAEGGLEVGEATRAWMASLGGSTLHRLLVRQPGSEVRFRHDARNHLPHDLVVVDEVSMVSLSLMARLLEAVRPEARLVLVGDHEQLASVEAGSVLGDIVGPAASGPRFRPARRAELTALDAVACVPAGGAGGETAGGAPRGSAAAGTAAPAIGDCVVVLRRVHRFGGSIAELASAVQRADAEAAIAVLERGAEDVGWIAGDPDLAGAEQLAGARHLAVEAAAAVHEAASAGDATGALEALRRFRLLCANRRGPHGVTVWQQVVEDWVASGVPGFGGGAVWAAGSHVYAGLPLLVTANDYDLRLYNGDSGVVVAGEGGRLSAVFESAGPQARFAIDRLAHVERCFASTVHKSQGSQFDAVAVVLPDAASPILTRELLYTAVTRARERVVVLGTPAAVRTAIERPIARASGLRRRLWG